MKENLHPTASFVDVFTSSNGFDYYDEQGNFHSKLETRRCWGAAFDTIRDTLGDNAPTSSEAGSDHLIGHLDGADCQLLQIGPEKARVRQPDRLRRLGMRALVRRREPRPIHSPRCGLFQSLRRGPLPRGARHRERRLSSAPNCSPATR